MTETNIKMKRYNTWEEKLFLGISNPPLGTHKIMNIYLNTHLDLIIIYFNDLTRTTETVTYYFEDNDPDKKVKQR